MNLLIVDNDLFIRLGCFLGIFAAMAIWEAVAPRRPLNTSKTSRWLTNLTVTALNSALVRLALPLSATAAALSAQERGWGILRLGAIPDPLAGIFSIVALDLVIYFQHRVFHTVRPFWLLHKMHHTDLDIDVTTGARFHPAEIILSMVIKIAAVLMLGAPAWSIVVFEVLLNGTSMFNHSNIRIKPVIDSVLRAVVVTPDMHRVHHSVITRETNSNYGFNLTWWDRLFGTYRAQPEAGHQRMGIGLANYRDPRLLTLPRLLLVPFDKKER